ncbi:MAG: GNAT family N-acetyltransferase [Halolamina sp.]
MPGARVTTGERVTLRTAETEDVPFLQRAYANPELRYPLGWDITTQTELEREFEDGGTHDEMFLVCLDDEDAGPGDPADGETRPIGCVIAATSERARSGIGFWLVPAVHGEGYATEAVSLVLDYLFRVYPHPAVYAKALPHNDASRGLLESLGFQEEGRARKEAFWDGEYHDSIAYSLLREEWQGEP